MPEREIDVPLDIGFDIQPETQACQATLVNMYVVNDEPSLNQVRVRRFRGKEALGSFANVVGARAAAIIQDVAYFLVGNKLFQVNVNDTISMVGQIGTSSGYAAIVGNQLIPTNQVLVVDGFGGYIWDGAAFTRITDVHFPARPIDAEQMDGYFLVLNGSNNQWVSSALNDGFTYPSNFQQVFSSENDQLSAIIKLDRRITLFGRNNIESWFDINSVSPTSGFPFARDNNVSIARGTEAPGSVASGFNRIFFLSFTKEGVDTICRIVGTEVEPIPLPAFTYAIRQFTKPQDAYGYITKTDDDHIQYILNFTADNRTFVWDETTGRLSEKMTLDGNRDQAQVHVYYNGKHLSAGYNDNILYQEGEQFLSNNGLAIPYILRTNNFGVSNFNRIRIDRLRIFINQLLDDGTTPDDELLLFLKISNDGGLTYGPEFKVQLKQQDNFEYIPTFRRIKVPGRFPVMEFKHIGKTKFNILGIRIYGEVLPT